MDGSFFFQKLPGKQRNLGDGQVNMRRLRAESLKTRSPRTGE
jgi:hypothetical protein